MGVNSLPKTVARQRRGCNLNPGPTAPESSTLSTRLPSHPIIGSSRLHCAKRKATSVRPSVRPSLPLLCLHRPSYGLPAVGKHYVFVMSVSVRACVCVLGQSLHSLIDLPSTPCLFAFLRYYGRRSQRTLRPFRLS